MAKLLEFIRILLNFWSKELFEFILLYQPIIKYTFQTPVYISGDEKINLKLVEQVVEKLEEKGLKIRSFAFDLGKCYIIRFWVRSQ